jgi:hypothetical protein
MFFSVQKEMKLTKTNLSCTYFSHAGLRGSRIASLCSTMPVVPGHLLFVMNFFSYFRPDFMLVVTTRFHFDVQVRILIKLLLFLPICRFACLLFENPVFFFSRSVQKGSGLLAWFGVRCDNKKDPTFQQRIKQCGGLKI